MEKDDYNDEAALPTFGDERIASIAQEKDIQRGEAVENFGSIETAEEYGYVARG